MGLLISEEWVNRTESYSSGSSDPYESAYDTTGTLYRALLREHGRCISRVYIDQGDKTLCVGWVFVKKAHYEDDRTKTYLQETWVTLHERMPERTIKHFYKEIGTKAAH